MKLDIWQLVFVGSALGMIAYQAFRGWRSGVGRQLFSLLALAGAYTVAIFGGELAVPVLRPAGYPDGVTQLASGCLLAVLVFFGINAVGAILFRKTAAHGSGMMRATCGVGGALVGVMFAAITIWMTAVGVRLVGTVAESEMQELEAARDSGRENYDARGRAEPSAVVRGLASMKQSLEGGATGAVVELIDPVPTTIYSTLRKVAQLVAQPDKVERFLAYPGARTITDHPKIVELFSDPEITESLLSQNYLALLRNERIVRVANDPEIAALVTRFELEQALDYALTPGLEDNVPSLP